MSDEQRHVITIERLEEKKKLKFRLENSWDF